MFNSHIRYRTFYNDGKNSLSFSFDLDGFYHWYDCQWIDREHTMDQWILSKEFHCEVYWQSSSIVMNYFEWIELYSDSSMVRHDHRVKPLYKSTNSFCVRKNKINKQKQIFFPKGEKNSLRNTFHCHTMDNHLHSIDIASYSMPMDIQTNCTYFSSIGKKKKKKDFTWHSDSKDWMSLLHCQMSFDRHQEGNFDLGKKSRCSN